MNLDALAELSRPEYDDGRRTICLFNAEWHPGVVGLVASRIKDRFHRRQSRSHARRLSAARLRTVDEGVHLRDTLDLSPKPHRIWSTSSAVTQWRQDSR